MILVHCQKVKTLRTLSMLISLSLPAPLLAGGVAGGGGPPAQQDLQLLRLGVDAPLQQELLVTRANDPSADLQISPEDFEQVAEGAPWIQAMNQEGEVRSYEVKKTEAPDTLRLVAP